MLFTTIYIKMDGENIIALPICIICSSYILALDEVVQSSDRARYVHEVVQHLLAIHGCPTLTTNKVIKHQHLSGHYRHIRCIYIVYLTIQSSPLNL